MKKNILTIDALFISTLTITVCASAMMFPLSARAQTTTVMPLCEISRSLTTGAQGEDVRCLQRYLNWAGYTVAPTGVGSPGNETDYFGPLTANAVARWQNAFATQVLAPVGLSSGTGFWGSSSFSWYVQLVRAALGIS